MKKSEHLRAIVKLYDHLAKGHGDSLVAVQRPKGRQDLIFSVLLDICDTSAFSVLDVGCGVGSLLEYLLKSGYDATYTGVDVSPEMVRICRNKFGASLMAEFFLGTVFDIPPARTFDYAVASGTFNNNPLKLSHVDFIDLVLDNLRAMFLLSRKGVSVNFASTYVDYIADGAFHVSPEAMFGFAKELSKRIAIRHDYMPYEFTLHIFKDDSVSRNHVFNAWDSER